MSTDRHIEVSTTSGHDGGNSGVLASRRQLLRGIAAVPPVVMTMASLPVHGQVVCINPSGFISPNTYASRHPNGLPPVCTVQGPSYFLTNFKTNGVWPTGTENDFFNTVFSGGIAFQGNPKLNDVLADASASKLAKYCVASYLHAKKGTSPFPMTEAQARALWPTITGMAPASPFPPLALGWKEIDVLKWLETVMPP